MGALLRVLAPLLGIALAAAGVLVVIEVVAAWLLPDIRSVSAGARSGRESPGRAW